MASRQPRTYPSDPDCFVIWLRDEDGTRVEAFEDYDPTKILVVKCIQVVRHMLLNTEVAVAFAKIATEYSKAHPNSWYMEDSKPGVQHMVRITRDFIESIIDKFPNVFVDYSMKTPNFLGCHCRREWVDWNPRNQSIQINGMRTRHMVEAQARRANKGPNDPDTRDFWHFVFMFTNTILHEISHVYITFLSKGARDADTPIHMNAPVLAQAEESVGEAGRWLERKLFQGTIHYYRDPDPGKETLAHQCALPYIKKDSGAYHRIKERQIYTTITTKFEFPYKHESDPQENLELMGDLPTEDTTDPLEHDAMKEVRGDTFI